MEIKTIGVAGAGTMGAGIAQLAAQNGLRVRLYDLDDGILARARERIAAGLEKARRPEATALVNGTTTLDDLADSDFAIEAVREDLSAKQDLFRRLDALIPSPRVLATNTSSLSVARIASAAEHPERVVGMHFFNPVPAMRLVEIVLAERTGEDAVRTALALAGRLGKTAARCKDTPGFIVNRVARPLYLAGMRLLEEGAGSPEEIDRAVRDEAGFRMGPLELADLIGLDVNLAISREIYEALGRPERFKPREVQVQLVSRGNLGRKNGRGFYVYDQGAPPTRNPALGEIVPGMGSRPARASAIARAVVAAVAEEASLVRAEGAASLDAIDTAMRLGMNWPSGWLARAADREIRR